MGSMITLSNGMIEALNGGMFDDRGLTRELTEDETMTLAGHLGRFKGDLRKVEEAVDLIAGDMINQTCKRNGLPALHPESAAKAHEKFSCLMPLLNKLGYTLSTAAQHATIARTWPRGDRVGGLSYGHYKALAGCDGKDGRLTREQARQILLEAQDGYRKPNGAWVKPQPPSWVKKRREDLEGKIKPRIELRTKEATVETANQVVPEVVKALKSTGISPRKAESIAKKVETAVKRTYETLQEDFSTAVHQEAVKQSKSMIEDYRKKAIETDRVREKLDKTIAGLAKPVSKDEWRYLRQFCHPDKHPGNEEKARKALEIVDRIGERLQLK